MEVRNPSLSSDRVLRLRVSLCNHYRPRNYASCVEAIRNVVHQSADGCLQLSTHVAH